MQCATVTCNMFLIYPSQELFATTAQNEMHKNVFNYSSILTKHVLDGLSGNRYRS